MNKIVGSFNIGENQHNLYVIKNGKIIKTISYNIKNINEELFKAIEKFSIDKIEFIGMTEYAKGLGNEFQKQMLLKYDKTIEIEYK